MANLGDSFEEAFQRIFGPARSKVQHATTDIPVDEDEQARHVTAEIAPRELPPYRRPEVPGETDEGQVPARGDPQEGATGANVFSARRQRPKGPGEIGY